MDSMPTGVYARQPKPLPDPMPRFWHFVKKTRGCWIWIGKRDHGYGKFWYIGRNITASRFAYEQLVCPIPEGLKVLHHCDNPPCVRPDHLFTGTTKDNTWDAIQKGRFDPYHIARVAPIKRGAENSRTKLTVDQVLEIRRAYQRGTAPYSTPHSLCGLARKYGVTKYTIFSIVHEITWRHLLDSVIV